MLPAGIVVTAQGFSSDEIDGHLNIQPGDRVKVLCSAAPVDGTIYGQLMSGERGWLPFDVLVPPSVDRGFARGSLVRSLIDWQVPPSRGYIALDEGMRLLVEYVGSPAMDDDGWLFGVVQGTEDSGWFPSDAVSVVGEAVQLHISGLPGQICNIAVDQNWTGLEVKSAIEAEIGVAWNEQRLFSGTVELLDGSSLPNAEGGILNLLLVSQNEHITWLGRVVENAGDLRNAPHSVRADREAVLGTVQRDGHTLQFASQALKSDRDIAIAAVRQNGLAFAYLPEELKTDRELAIAAVQNDGLSLDYMPPQLKSDRDIVSKAIQQTWRALEFASSEQRHDVDICWAAVQQSRQALDYVLGAARDECHRRLSAWPH